MRYITHLTAEEKTTLEEGFRNHEKHHFRIRCKTILLSDEGFSVPEIARFFKIRTRTIYDWFNRFESIGIVGLMILSGRGRKAVLDACDDDEIITIKEIVRGHPQSIRKICEKLNGMIDFSIKITENMLRRFLKKCLRYSWKRLRKVLKKFPDPDEYDQKVKELAELFCLEAEGFLNIYFADESSFSLTPSVPYGWQKIGETDGIPSERSSKINIFGLMSRENELHSYFSMENFTSKRVISCIDDFFMFHEKGRSVIIIDNSSIHTSFMFQEKIKEWREMDLHVFFLPKYSPHLNLIEILWRKMKYEWLKPKDYENLKILEEALKNISYGFGRDFFINFTIPKMSII